MQKEKRKIRVEIINPKTKEEWEEKINRINEYLFYKYTKKDPQSIQKPVDQNVISK